MKKIFKSLLVSMVMVVAMTASVFANPVTDLRDDLLSVGVPNSYVGTIVEYLQKTTISDSQYNAAMGHINEAKAIIGDTKDIRDLSTSDKNTVQSLVSKAGNTLGLNIKFGKNAQGITTVVATDAKGGTILKMTTQDVIGSVENFDPSAIIGIFNSMVEFSNNPDKGNFTPVGGELTQTATSYGNIMVIGVAMVAVAIGMVVVGKKQFA